MLLIRSQNGTELLVSEETAQAMLLNKGEYELVEQKPKRAQAKRKPESAPAASVQSPAAAAVPGAAAKPTSK